MIENNQLYDFEEEPSINEDSEKESAAEPHPTHMGTQAIVAALTLGMMLAISWGSPVWVRWTRERLHQAVNASTASTFGAIAGSKAVKTIIQKGRNLIRLEEISGQFSSYLPNSTEKSAFYDWVWPVQGNLVKKFGWSSQLSGFIKEYNPGIEIAASAGSPVLAVAAGQVVELAGDGGDNRSISINHGNGWVSTYRRLQTVTVKNGDLVRAGEIIARLGPAAKISDAKLYFEIKKNNHPVDPLAILSNS